MILINSWLYLTYNNKLCYSTIKLIIIKKPTVGYKIDKSILKTPRVADVLLKHHDIKHSRPRAKDIRLKLRLLSSKAPDISHHLFSQHYATIKMTDPQNTTDMPEILAAAEAGSYEDVDKLLKQGVDPNTVGDSGKTALHIAAGNGLSDITNLLLENNASPRLDSSQGLPIHAAIRCNKPGIVSLYLERYPLQTKKAREELHHHLCIAAKNGDLDVVKVLLAHKVPTRLPGKGSALLSAAEVDKMEVCDFLLKHEIAHRPILARSLGHLDLEPVHGKRFFQWGVETWSPQLVGVFLKNLPYLCHARTDDGSPCFFRAVHEMKVLVAEEFFKHGLDIEMKNRSGQRALHIAVQRAEYYANQALESAEKPMSRQRKVDKVTAKSMIELLLENGASIAAKDDWGRTPLYYTKDTTLKEFMRRKSKPLKSRGLIYLLARQTSS